MFVEDIDLEVELSLGLLTNGTSASYETYLKKFAIFIHQEDESKMRFRQNGFATTMLPRGIR
jgi:hypothetical protein